MSSHSQIDLRQILLEAARDRLRSLGPGDRHEALLAIHSLHGSASAAGLSDLISLVSRVEDDLIQGQPGAVDRARQEIRHALDAPSRTPEDDEDRELIECFVEEARDHLATIRRQLRRLRQRSDDREAQDEVYRALHTFKGAASMVEQTQAARAAHELEDLLQEVLAASEPLDDQRLSRIEEGVRDLAAIVARASNDIGVDVDVDVERKAREEIGAGSSARLRDSATVRAGWLFQRLEAVGKETARRLGRWLVFERRGDKVELDRRLAEILLDPLAHIVRNAVVHGIETPAQRVAMGKGLSGHLVFEAAIAGRDAVIAVVDDGRGIDIDGVGRVLVERGLLTSSEVSRSSRDQLHQAVFLSGLSTRPETDELAGRGMGLDAVRAEVERHGGRVGVESEAGRGARFVVRIPLIAPRAFRLLVVEDSPSARAVIAGTLAEAGFEVEAVADGLDAWDRLCREPFDLLVTDLEMPRLDGFNLVERVRAEARLAGLPVVVLTANRDEEHLLRVEALEVDALVIKQAGGERLISAVRRAVKP